MIPSLKDNTAGGLYNNIKLLTFNATVLLNGTCDDFSITGKVQEVYSLFNTISVWSSGYVILRPYRMSVILH